jgi:hypothetical protein
MTIASLLLIFFLTPESGNYTSIDEAAAEKVSGETLLWRIFLVPAKFARGSHS